MWLCSGVRVVLFSEPISFTSLTSAAYWALVRGKGPAVWNWEALFTRNGTALPTQGDGSQRRPVGPTSGCQAPGPEPNTHGST
jgi:hypothetical protein